MYSYKREAWGDGYRRENTARRRGDETTEAETKKEQWHLPRARQDRKTFSQEPLEGAQLY